METIQQCEIREGLVSVETIFFHTACSDMQTFPEFKGKEMKG
jgi:hypothetical protein